MRKSEDKSIKIYEQHTYKKRIKKKSQKTARSRRKHPSTAAPELAFSQILVLLWHQTYVGLTKSSADFQKLNLPVLL